MKKLLTIIVVVLIGFALVSCDKDEPSVVRNTQVENTTLVDDLVGEIKGVFEEDQ